MEQELRKWLKGPKLAEWLESFNPTDPTSQRVIRGFRATRRVSFYTVDATLTRMGLHEPDIPERLWYRR